jgi:hypothetical protein
MTGQSDEHLRGVGQRCLGLGTVQAADVITDADGEAVLELVVPGAEGRVPPSVLAVLAGGGVGVVSVATQGTADDRTFVVRAR